MTLKSDCLRIICNIEYRHTQNIILEQLIINYNKLIIIPQCLLTSTPLPFSSWSCLIAVLLIVGLVRSYSNPNFLRGSLLYFNWLTKILCVKYKARGKTSTYPSYSYQIPCTYNTQIPSIKSYGSFEEYVINIMIK